MSLVTTTEEEAKANFGRYLEAAERGDTVVITRGDRPVAQIAPVPPQMSGRAALVASPRLANRQDGADFVLQVEADAPV